MCGGKRWGQRQRPRQQQQRRRTLPLLIHQRLGAEHVGIQNQRLAAGQVVQAPQAVQIVAAQLQDGKNKRRAGGKSMGCFGGGARALSSMPAGTACRLAFLSAATRWPAPPTCLHCAGVASSPLRHLASNLRSRRSVLSTSSSLVPWPTMRCLHAGVAGTQPHAGPVIQNSSGDSTALTCWQRGSSPANTHPGWRAAGCRHCKVACPRRT